ncbi:hypothetical protein DMI72_04855 [Akkermansia muciniphila]|uniref:beta family protein n=1 Tax=Akkermansia muciniphila TaxID=239935 RepID=UPI00138E74C3|nr:hypothetical protein [Akkermansia muciniphila]QHV55592.1 hypothetical protein DMI72_04855 [Akkermansia muciniphila]
MNWNNYFYVPFLKTLDAEFKAIQELTPEVKAKILPFVILTKGRASSKASLEKILIKSMAISIKIFRNGKMPLMNYVLFS